MVVHLIKEICFFEKEKFLKSQELKVSDSFKVFKGKKS